MPASWVSAWWELSSWVAECLLLCPPMAERDWSLSSLNTRILISYVRVSPSWPNYLPKDLHPNPITLGIRSSTFEFRIDTFTLQQISSRDLLCNRVLNSYQHCIVHWKFWEGKAMQGNEKERKEGKELFGQWMILILIYSEVNVIHILKNQFHTFLFLDQFVIVI